MNRFKSMLLTSALTVSVNVAWAAPAPFGLELGVATIGQMDQKYTTSFKGVNKYSSGKMYDLSVNELGVSGIKSATVIFDVEGKLVAVLTTWPKRRFDELYDSLSTKYQVKSSVIPFVGDKNVVFKDGATEITLDAPHMSFDMDLNYINADFYRSYQQKSKQEEVAKRSQETSQL